MFLPSDYSIRQTSPEDFETETSLSLSSSTVDYDSQGRVKFEEPLMLYHVIRHCHHPATLHCAGLAIVCRHKGMQYQLPSAFRRVAVNSMSLFLLFLPGKMQQISQTKLGLVVFL